MKSHFPLVTQQATTELWTQKGNETPRVFLRVPEILMTIQPLSTPMHPSMEAHSDLQLSSLPLALLLLH